MTLRGVKFAGLAALVAGCLAAAPAWCESGAAAPAHSTISPDSARADNQASAPSLATGTDTAEAGVPAQPAGKRTLRQRVKDFVAKLSPIRLKMNREFKKAEAAFPGFCQHWAQDLRDRESNNLANLNFADKSGFKTATYTGYGKVETCTAHQSKEGFAIGKIVYKEYEYYIVGRSESEARRAVRKTISSTNTLEIFRWENGKWFY